VEGVAVIDVGEVINDPDFARTFTVQRPTGTLANEGVSRKTWSTLDRSGVVQPAEPADLAILPEGTRINNTIKLWCTEELRVGDGKTDSADIVIVDAKKYRVIRSEEWPIAGGAGYWKVWAEGFVT
jgi:hypothetical protein